ncbi:RluA family pseudouridine synthase [Candidatus Saccharibacteria bacterium]|nr:RluA family pseudouridine synthase [Candidatus Saccharibacteria bacterium]
MNDKKHVQEINVTPTDYGLRADIFIASNNPQFTRATLAKLFDGVHVLVNGQSVKHGYKLRAGDRIKLDTSPLESIPVTVNIPVIYENNDVVVMDKPAGMLTHSKGSFNAEATVASFLATKITDPHLAGNRAGIVHRLDRVTSGVIIGAKNSATQTWLQKQFSSRKVKKTYLAVVEGVPEPKIATIDAPIGRNPKYPQTFIVTPLGRPAQTEYKILKTVSIDGKNKSLVELKPTTGRTHQLRVHMAYIRHPIVGDSVYGHQGQHMMLHAYKLELTIPGGQRKVFSAPTPESFKGLV